MVIGGNNPTVSVTVPVPQPAPMAKKPAAPQPVPANVDSKQQAVPQGMASQPPAIQQPEPRAVILPWAPQPAQNQPVRSHRLYKKSPSSKSKTKTPKPPPGRLGNRDWQAKDPGAVAPEQGLYDEAPDSPSESGPAGSHVAGWQLLGGKVHKKFNVVETQDKSGKITRRFQIASQADPGARAILRVSFKKGGSIYEYYFADADQAKKYLSKLRRSSHPGKVIWELRNAGNSYKRVYARPIRYAAGDDLSMDFDSMGDDELPREEKPRPQPKEDITGRTRRQILLQMLEAAKKGHYDAAGMSPSEVIKDMETKEDKPDHGVLYDPFTDPESGMMEKMSRTTYRPVRMAMHPEHVENVFNAVAKQPESEELKHALADTLEQQGRTDEAHLLRSGLPHAVEHAPGTGWKVRKGQFDPTHINRAQQEVTGFLHDNTGGDYDFGDRHAYFTPEEWNHAKGRFFYPEHFQEDNQEHYDQVPEGHIRAVQYGYEGDPDSKHYFEDVPWSELGSKMAGDIDDDSNQAGIWGAYDDLHQNEAEYDQLLDALRNAKYYR